MKHLQEHHLMIRRVTLTTKHKSDTIKREPSLVEKVKYIGDFVSDGCSMSPDLTFSDCCEVHDLEYITGVDRRVADKNLRECIRSKGYPFLCWVYWLGVRLGGWWGYYFGPSAKRREVYLHNLEKEVLDKTDKS